ncbi:minichromosome maintenance protein MCM, partial [archaeon]
MSLNIIHYGLLRFILYYSPHHIPYTIHHIPYTIHHTPYTMRHREFYVSFYNLPHVFSLRQLRSKLVGRLLCVEGVCIRTGEVRPLLAYAHFVCTKCGGIYPHVEQQGGLAPPPLCTSPSCSNRGGAFVLLPERCVYVDSQRG